MAGTPFKTAKKLAKLKMLLQFVFEAVIEETPERYTDLYEDVEPLPEGDTIGKHYFEMREAACEADWQVGILLDRAKAELSESQLAKLAEIEDAGSYSKCGHEFSWTNQRHRREPPTQSNQATAN